MKPSRPFLFALAILVIASVGLWLLLRQRATTVNRDIAEEIQWVIGRPHRRATATELDSRALWEEVAKFYRERKAMPVWLDGTSVRPEAIQLLGCLSGMNKEGIDPARYEADSLTAVTAGIRAADYSKNPPLPMLARWDVHLTHAFFLAARDLRDGRVSKEALDKSWWPKRNREDLVRVMEEAVKARHPKSALAAIAPQDPGYARLRDALIRYRAIEKAGGWDALANQDLKRGATGIAVALLQRRLAVTGDLADGGESGRYDRSLESAVKAVQSRFGLDTTGRVDAVTRGALNVPVSHRIRQMELNLERWRWLPDTLGQPRIDVNIPAFTLVVRDSDRVVMNMRVVTGKVDSQTPLFSAKVSYLEVNPVWRLPLRIVAREIMPLFQKDHEYFAKQNMVVSYRQSADTTTIDPAYLDWAAASDSASPYIVLQRAGPTNPLGRIKLMCPNPYDVYLHDTPARRYFQDNFRALSHGCVRLEHPLELAQRVAAEEVEPDTLAAVVERGESKQIGIHKKVPVHFLYWTAWVDDQGVVQFRKDVYGLDQRLDAALRGQDLAAFRVNLPPEQMEAHP